MTTRESATETRLTRAVRRAGAFTYKCAPTLTGIPDRLVVWPTGVVDFVEVKAPDGTVAPIQQQRIRELRKRGANTFVLFGDPEVDDYVRTRLVDLSLPAVAAR